MKAVTVSSSGGPEALHFEDIAKPFIVNDEQLLVKVKAAGINPIDTKIRKAVDQFPLTLPAILGCDAAGIVEAVGASVEGFKPGDAVYFCQPGLRGRQGTYAEYSVVEQSLAAPKPESLSFIETAAAPLVLITAWEALHDRVTLQADQTVLIPAGAGGVGHVAIQLAKLAGAKVCTSVSTPQKADFVRKLGADKIIRYQEEDTVEQVIEWTDGAGVDIAFDTIGGRVFQQCLACTRCYGDVVTLLQPEAAVDWSEARIRNLRISLEIMLSPILLDLKSWRSHQGEILKHCGSLFDEGKLRVEVSQSFPLEQAAEAHRCLESDSPMGKIVLTLD